MTAPAPDTLEREQVKQFLTDAELIRRLGVPHLQTDLPRVILFGPVAACAYSARILSVINPATGRVGTRRAADLVAGSREGMVR